VKGNHISIENPEFRYGQFVAYSANHDIRHRGSSGGVISTIIKYLFETGRISTAINLRFAQQDLYKPELVHSFSEYEITGSIYHEIGLYRFLKTNLDAISPPVIVTSLPCQVMSIKNLFERNHIDAYFLACTCSGQLSREATYYLMRKLKIKPEDVSSLRYRGNGWPSGVQIKTADRDFFLPNNDSIWFDIFHSQVFTLKCCFHCADTFGLKADVTVADPWLKKYIQNDKEGSSLVMLHSERGRELMTEMLENRYLAKVEDVSRETVLLSQRTTLEKKYVYLKHPKLVKYMLRVIRCRYYIDMLRILSFERLHRRIINRIIRALFMLSSRKGGEQHEAIVDKPTYI